MPVFACHNNDKFLLTIETETKQQAEDITELHAVRVVDSKPQAGWIIENGQFRPPKPFESWKWDGIEWVPPISKPNDIEGFFYWNEAERSWSLVEQDQPYPSWIVDEKNGNWIAPKPVPQLNNIIINDDGSTSIINVEENFQWNESLLDWELIN